MDNRGPPMPGSRPGPGPGPGWGPGVGPGWARGYPGPPFRRMRGGGLLRFLFLGTFVWFISKMT